MQKPLGTITYHDKNGSSSALWFAIKIVNVHIEQSVSLVLKTVFDDQDSETESERVRNQRAPIN